MNRRPPNRAARRKAKDSSPPTSTGNHPSIKTYFVKATMPRLVTSDTPKIRLLSKDGTFDEEVQITSQTVKWMAGKYEAWFLLRKDSLKIHSMKKITEQEYLDEKLAQPEGDEPSHKALPVLAPEHLEKGGNAH